MKSFLKECMESLGNVLHHSHTHPLNVRMDNLQPTSSQWMLCFVHKSRKCAVCSNKVISPSPLNLKFDKSSIILTGTFRFVCLEKHAEVMIWGEVIK